MHYTGTIWRPPYEAYSALIQVTAGCTHHKCKFCTLYEDVPFKFRMSPLAEVEEDLKEISRYYRNAKRVFFTGANPFVLSFDKLKTLAELVKKYYPKVGSIGCFARITDITPKTTEQLRELRELGYNSLTIGVEAGDDEYRFDKVRERAKLKQSVSRLVTILFPELEKLVPSLHIASVYALLSEYPGAKQISEIHLTKLTNLLATASKGRYGKDKAIQIRDAARTSIGSVMPAKFLELKHTIKLIRELTSEIDEIEVSIQKIMDELNPPILSIPGVGIQSAAMILAEIGDFSNFESPDKILAYAGCSPSTYQSGKLTNCYAHMEKRGSRYLRYALYNATKYVCHWNPVFAEYLAKKRAEGKHYNVALSHATKKLVRLIYALQKSGKAYLVAA